MAYDPRATQAHKRNIRMQAAKAKGRHTPKEWQELKAFYGFRCVRCGIRELKGENIRNQIVLEKDHIVPVSQNGCNCIGNIQPLCQTCNNLKSTTSADYRQEAKERWGLNGES